MHQGRSFSEYVRGVLERLSVRGNDLTSRLDLLERLGLSRSEIERDLADLLDQRIFLWLVGEVRADINYADRRRFVARRLGKLLHDYALQDRAEVDEIITELAECQGHVSSATESPREGVGSAEEIGLRELLAAQGHRCAVCGVPLLAAKRLSTTWFDDGLEPLGEQHLDHVIPYYFLGNSTDTEVLCGKCNVLKSDRIGVHEDGFVVAGNHIRKKQKESIKRRMAFWALYHHRRCDLPGCFGAANSSTMLVKERDGRPFTYGNIAIRCLSHAEHGFFWLHSELR